MSRGENRVSPNILRNVSPLVVVNQHMVFEQVPIVIFPRRPCIALHDTHVCLRGRNRGVGIKLTGTS